MRKSRRNASAETRFRHKLNMLEPGTEMLRWTGMLLMVGLALRLIGLKTPAAVAFGLAGALFLLLMILLAVEAHQDRVLNEIAVKEEKPDGRKSTEEIHEEARCRKEVRRKSRLFPLETGGFESPWLCSHPSVRSTLGSLR